MEHTNPSYDDGASTYDSITDNEGHYPDKKGEPNAKSNENKGNTNNQPSKMIISKRSIIAVIVGMIVIAVVSSSITGTILKQVR